MRTIERAFAVLECFSPSRPSLTLQEIANRIDLAKSTTFRVVGTLERMGYLVRMPDLRYSLSLTFLSLADVARRSLDVRRLLRPILESLVLSSGENVSLHSLHGCLRHCVDIARSRSPLVGMNKPDEDVPLGLGAASIVLMAYVTKGASGKIPAAYAVKCSPKELRSIVETTRQHGYAVSHGGGVPSLTGISVPIFNSDGTVDYALAVVLPTARAAGRVMDLVSMTKQAAALASERLGGIGGLRYANCGNGQAHSVGTPLPDRPASRVKPTISATF